eukprot:GHUV01013118.1.p1 GENE.GHUV01013118.1~~GHUV01013118.1.p1  ORF type:complete len:1009 (+),score=321.88 GHUV01013118.1:364-3390(+)
MKALVEEQQKGVVHKVCDTVSELAADLLDKNAWPEILPHLQELISSNNPAAMEAALLILANLASYSTDHLRPHLGGLTPVLGSCLAHSSIDVQVAALHACCNFINSLDDAHERDLFQPMIVPMLTALGRCLSASDESNAQDVLELLIEVAESYPKFMRKNLQEVVSAMMQITTAAQLESPTRSLAAECLVTLCEARDKAPGMVRRLPNFVPTLFDALMNFLLDVDDVPDWHRGDTDAYEDDGANELFDAGQEFLDRIAIALGGKALVPAAGTLLPVWLSDADWHKRHAALICLAQIAEGCEKMMQEQVEPLVQMCLTGLSDTHPKVRWASCQALGQMCTDLGPELQQRCGNAVLPALLAAMDDFNNPRVQAHAAATVVNFSEGCESDLMAPHLDALIAKLLTLLQQGKKIVQEGALTALASVADCSQEQFVRYYDAVMPLLSQILNNAQNKEHRLLRAKALECVSLVGMAVGRDRFRSDAQAVMAFMQQLAANPMESDDPTQSYMLQAGARLCKALGLEFLPYLPVVMPPLLAAARVEPEMKVHDPDVVEFEDDDDVEHIQLGDKVLAIRTSSLEEKATACNMIVCYVDELREGFFPYVKEVTDLMVPLLKFYFHEEVRRAAVSALPNLVRAAQSAAEKDVPGASKEFTVQMISFMWEPLIAAIKKEPEPDITAAMLDSLAEIVDLAEPGQLSGPQVQAAFGALQNILTAAEGRRTQRNKRVAAEDFDEEEEEALAAENEAEEELYDQVGSCLGNFLKVFGDAALPYVEGLMPSIAPLLDKSRPDEERRIALCIIDDMLEHSPAGRTKYLGQLMPVLLDACGSCHSDLRQCAVYGVGVGASLAPEVFKQHAPAALAAVTAIITAPDAKGDDNEMATDNALSALAALIEHHSDVCAADGMVELLVSGLPLKCDAVEAQKVNEWLVKRLEAQDQRLLGPSNKHLPKLVASFVETLGRATDLVEEGVGLRMAGLLNALGSSVPGTLEAAFTIMKDKQKANFQSYMSGQVPK